MPEIVQTVARFGFLILLWLFVFAAARTITRDLLAQRRPATAGGPGPVSAPPAPGGRQSRQQAAQWLVVTTGELAGRRFTLSGQPISIGRAPDSTIVIRDDFASNRHARVAPVDGQWVVEDLGSTNGTYLGRARVTSPTPVPLGVPIRIGRSSFELRALCLTATAVDFMSLHLRYAAISDRGVVRQGNQDSVYAGPHFIAVADGMGGMAAGDLASAIVINTVARLDEPPPEESVADELADTVAEANRAIRRMVADDPDKEGMGTTLTALWFDGEWFNMVHIGDSRAYRMRDGGFEQITVDDTYVQMLVDEGRITAEEAERHPQRSLLLRALGASEVEPAFQTLKGVPGDRLLLCSDGLTGPVADADIALALQSAATPAEAVESLVGQALEAGAPDNVTVLIADVVEGDPGEQAPIIAGAAADARLAESDTAVLPAIRRGDADASDEAAESDGEAEPKGKRRGGRVWRTVLAALIVLVLAAGGGLWWVRTHYFIGVSEAGNISVFRGMPVEVAGVEAAWLEIESERPAEDAVQDVQEDLDEGITADSIEDAESELAELTDAAATNEHLVPLCSSGDSSTDTQPAATADCRES